MFQYDNKFFLILNEIVDCFYVSVLWLIFCLPIVTIGASTTALYETVHSVIKGKRGYIWSRFWAVFKENCKDSIKIAIPLEVLFCFVVVDKRMFYDILTQGSKLGSLYYFFYFAQFMILVWGIYIFTYRARFELDWKHSMKNGAILFVANLPWTIVLGVILIVAVVLVLYYPFLAFVLPAVVSLIYDLILERIFRKHMTPEELEHEKELDMERKKGNGSKKSL